MPRRRRSERMSDILASYIERLDAKGRRFEANVLDAWAASTGPSVSAHASAAALKDGELIVTVDAPAWAAELTLMHDAFVAAVNERLGSPIVERIRFTVPRRETHRRRERVMQQRTDAYYTGKRSRVPLTERELEQIRYAAAVIEDEGLRAVAIRTMAKDLEYKKGARVAEEGTPGGHDERGGAGQR